MIRQNVECALAAAGWHDYEIAVHRSVRVAKNVTSASRQISAPLVLTGSSVHWPTDRLDTLIARRSSCRSFTRQPLALDTLLDVLVPASLSSTGRRAYAAPGAKPSITTTILVHRLEFDDSAVPAGMYEFLPDDRKLRSTCLAPFDIVSACVDLTDVTDPAVVVLLCLHLDRRRKYSNAYELGLLEAGQLLQNIALTATSVGVGQCALGSVFDEPYWSVVDQADHTADVVRRRGAPLVAIALGHRSGRGEDAG